MKKMIAVLTLIAGSAAVTGTVLQRMEKLQNVRPRKLYRVRTFQGKNGCVAVAAAGKVPPDSIPERLRNRGSKVWERGTRYLSRTRIGA